MITGTVENGRQVDIEIGRVRTRAGIRERGDLIEVAYLGSTPPKLPANMTIDGESAHAYGLLANVADRFIGLACRKGQLPE